MHIDLRAALGAIVRAESADLLASATCTSLATSRSVILARLWLVDWDKTASVAIHLGLITLVAMFAASAWLGRDRAVQVERES